MRKNGFPVICLLVLLSGCGHGLVGKLPTIEDSNNTSEIIFIRECEIAGSAGSVAILIDGNELFKIMRCEYTRFILPPGPHNILMRGVMDDYGLDVNLLSKNKYYYLATMYLFQIYPIPENIAIQKILGFSKEDKYMQIDNRLGPITH